MMKATGNRFKLKSCNDENHSGTHTGNLPDTSTGTRRREASHRQPSCREPMPVMAITHPVNK